MAKLVPGCVVHFATLTVSLSCVARLNFPAVP